MFCPNTGTKFHEPYHLNHVILHLVNELMMLNEYQSQGHSLTLVKGHSDFKVRTCFLINSWAIWNQNSYESFRENRNENLYK